MCVDFRKINELQPKMQMVDKQTDTQGNLSLIPLPKIDKMYTNLRGAKYSPHWIYEVVTTTSL